MKLLSEKEVEEVAKEYAKGKSYAEVFQENHIKDFNAGFSFAESKLTPLMIEFAEWIGKYDYCQNSLGTWKRQVKTNVDAITTEQLLEQFLNTKQ